MSKEKVSLFIKVVPIEAMRGLTEQRLKSFLI
jgi:hypothetical protein